MGLKIDFGLRLGFLDHILGSIKSLGSTHGADHFGSDSISRHWDQGLRYRSEQNGVYSFPLSALPWAAMPKDYRDNLVVLVNTRAPPMHTSLKQSVQWGSKLMT